MATTITPTIVNLNASQTVASAPSQLQQSGAVVSGGGTTIPAGTYLYCGSVAAVTAVLNPPLPILALTWSAGVVTGTQIGSFGIATGQTFITTISGASPSAYNGTFVATVTSATSFTYALSTNPGSEIAPGTFTPPYVAFLLDIATSFFAQGSEVGFYILELGTETTATLGITALSTWIIANSNPQVFYVYLTAPSWDGTALNTLAASYASPNGHTYFVTTSMTSTIVNYVPNKSVYCTVPYSGEMTSVSDAAVHFYQMLVNNPSAANPAGPLAFRYVYGVTPFPANSTQINTILTGYANYIGTGAEGGISLSVIRNGTTMDGNQFMYWYGIDWVAIQVKQALAAAVINGSNQNPPLIYNQKGINTLLAVAQDVCNTAVAFQLVNSAVVTAQSFASYVAQNPSNYAAGLYGGFACTIVGQNGFLSITFNIQATQFA